MSQNFEISARICQQALRLPSEPVANESYHKLIASVAGAALTCHVNANASHAGFVVTGDPEMRRAVVRDFDLLYPAGLTVDTAYGPVTGRLAHDPNGDRFLIGRWSLPGNGIRFDDGQHVAKAVARGFLMAVLVRTLMPIVEAASPAPALSAAA